MDYKERVLMLVSECEKLSEEIKKINSDFDSLSKSRDKLKNQEKALVEKASPLAKELLKDVRFYIEEMEKQLEGYTTSMQEMQEELEKKTKQFNDMCNVHTGYIEEQVSMMVANLMSYIKKNLRSIGMDISTSFEMKVKKADRRINGEIIEVPTGEIVLSHCKYNNVVAESDGYPLNDSLYTITYNNYGPGCAYTEKFMRYIAEFGRQLCSEIKNKVESDTFSVSFENGKITLELK